MAGKPKDRRTVLNELYKMTSDNGYRKRVYFIWKNKLKTSGEIDYSQLSKDEFIERFCKGSNKIFKELEKWEKTKHYQRLLLMCLDENFILDLQKTYEKVKEKALDGDEKAVKLMLMLQKELRQLLKTFNNADISNTEQEEKKEDDDDLIIE